MFLDWIILAASFVLQFVLIPKPQNAKPASLSDFDLPVCEEGKEFGVLSGTEMLKGPNVTWWGDLKVDPIKGERRYGLFGPRQVIGYKYSLGIQMTLCNGPADALLEIWIGDKLAWSGESTGGIIEINQPDLFGGDDREGGIVGLVEVNMGAPTQGRSDYLAQAQNLGPDCSAFRGVVTIVLRQVYIGNNAYIKPWAFKLKRIHLKSDNTEQWYDAKAEVPDSHVGTAPSETGTELLASPAYGNGQMTYDTNSKWAVEAGNFNGSTFDGLIHVWDISVDPPTEQTTAYTGIGQVAALITDEGVVIFRTGGNGDGDIPTYLTFRDPADLSTTTQADIDLTPYMVSLQLNFGFLAAQYGSHILMRTGPATPFYGQPWLLLSLSLGTWSVQASHGDSLMSASLTEMSMGPNYGYATDSGSKIVRLIHWNGSWSEVDVDLSTAIPSPYDYIAAVHYSAATNEVVVFAVDISGTGRIYVFDEALTTVQRSIASNFSGVTHRVGMSDGTIVILDGSTETGTYKQILVADLSTVREIDAVDTGYVNKTEPVTWLLRNEQYGYFKTFHAGTVNFWPDVPVVGYDMNPAHIIREYLTDPFWGMGYNVSDVDDDAFTYAADLFWDECFGLTIFWVKQEKVDEMVNIILAHVNAVLYTSRRTGKFILKPIRSDYVTSELLVVDEDDVIAWTEVKRRQLPDAITSITAKYTERRLPGANSSDGATTFHNDAQVQQSGGIVLDTREYPGISRFSLAHRVAGRDQHPFTAGMIDGAFLGKRSVQVLNPGDAFRLVSARHNLTGQIMRVVDIKFNNPRDNGIALKFIQDVFRLQAVDLQDTSETTWERPGSDAVAVDPRLVWEMPYSEMVNLIGISDATTALTGDADFGMLEVAGEQSSSDTISIDIYVDAVKSPESLDSFAPSGFLATDIADENETTVSITSTTNFDNITVGMLAALIEVDPRETEVVQILARSDDDLVFDRGMLDTVRRPHVAGTALVVFDDSVASDFESHSASDALFVKLLSRTPTGVLSYGSAPSDTVTFDSRAIRPYRPADTKVEGDDGSGGAVDVTAIDPFEVTWANRDRLTRSLLWTEASVALEAGATITIALIDGDGTTIIDDTTYAGLTGTSTNINHADFGVGVDQAYVRFTTVRDGYGPWQAYQIPIILFTSIVLSVDSGSYSLSGTAATLHKGVILGAGAGSYTLTGTSVSLVTVRMIAAGAGSYSLTGASTTLKTNIPLVAGAGSYTLTGTSVTLSTFAGTTWNPNDKSALLTLSNGNLTAVCNTGNYANCRSVDGKSSGKYYVEISLDAGDDANWIAGVGNSLAAIQTFYVGFDGNSGGLGATGSFAPSIGGGSDGNPAVGDKVCMAIDATNRLGWWRVNGGDWNGSSSNDPATGVGGKTLMSGTSGPLYLMFTSFSGNQCTLNAGATAFSQSVPSGFTAGWPVSTTTLVPATVSSATLLANYDASLLAGSDNDPIGSWTDQSGNAFHATQSGSARPTLKTASQNGLNILRFDGTDDYFDIPNIWGAATGASMFVVMKIANDPPATSLKAGDWRFGTENNVGSAGAYPFTDGLIYDGFASTARKTVGDPPVAMNVWRVHYLYSIASDWGLFISGAQFFQTGTNTVGLHSAPTFGRANSSTTNIFMDADVAQVIIYNGKLSAADRDDLYLYLKNKWNTGT